MIQVRNFVWSFEWFLFVLSLLIVISYFLPKLRKKVLRKWRIFFVSFSFSFLTVFFTICEQRELPQLYRKKGTVFPLKLIQFFSASLISRKKIWLQGSISSMFSLCLLCTKASFWRQNLIRKLFFRFEIFGAKILNEICARIMLMKLTLGLLYILISL